MTTRQLLMAAGVAAMACLLSSCQAIGFGVAALAPPQKIKPLYKLPANKKVLVFVDDKASPVTYPPIKRELAEELGKQLMEHKLAKETIPYDTLLDLIAREPKFNNLGVADVGRKVGADIVIYVDIKTFRLREEERSPLWEGQLETSVRVVDVWAKKGETRLWPKDAGEFNVPAVGMPAKEEVGDYGTELARDLARRMADRICKLFYEYEVPAMDVQEK